MSLLAITAAVAMSGPHTTAFAQTCLELQRDQPTLTCARVKSLRVGGHPVQIWETRTHVEPDEGEEESQTIQIFVAIQTHDGWYVSDPVDAIQTFHENGHHNAGGSASIDRIDARAVKIDKHHAAKLRVVESWQGFCTPCDDANQHTHGTTIVEPVCVVDDGLVPHCDVPDAAQ